MKTFILIYGILCIHFVLSAEAIRITDSTETEDTRNKLINYIWEGKGQPTKRVPDSIQYNIKDPFYLSLYSPEGNLARIDKYVIEMDSGFTSYIYHFHSMVSNGKLFIYHAGHSENGFSAEDAVINNGSSPGKVIPALLRDGYDVLAISMPLYGNTNPVLTIQNGDNKEKFIYHGQMFAYLPHPYTYFFDPLVICLNYLEDNYSYRNISMLGLSGGGWTTTVFQALDLRIKQGFEVAGSIPLDLRPGYEGLGDSEQGYDYTGLYGIANYQELYTLSSVGFQRRHVQILNRYDDQTFWGQRHTAWVDNVKHAVSEIGSGEYNFYLDETEHRHTISEFALKIILDTLTGITPDIPLLVSPQDNLLVEQKGIYFDWLQASRAEYFDIQISTDSNFVSIFFEDARIKSYMSETSHDMVIPNNYYWRLRASNSGGISDWSEIRKFSISNNPPSFSSASPVSVVEEVKYQYCIKAIDADSISYGDSVHYRILSKPSWIQYDADLITLHGVPLIGTPDTVIIIEAYDLRGGRDFQMIPLHVVHVNHAPAILSTPEFFAHEDLPYIYKVIAHDADSAYYHDSISFRLGICPKWVSINNISGVIQGVPSALNVSDTTISIIVSDNNGESTEQKYNLRVLHTNHAPQIISVAVMNVVEDSQYRYDVKAIDQDNALFGDQVHYRFVHKPAWVSIDSLSGSITGIPRITDLRDTAVTVMAYDSVGGSAIQQFVIRIQHTNHVPIITASEVLTANEDSSFAYAVKAADIDTLVGDVLRYRLSLKPVWMQIDSVHGIISGAPRGVNVGDTTFSILIVDGKGGAASQLYNVKVLHTNHSPLISSTAVTSATEDSLYRYDLKATDQDTNLFGDRIGYRFNIKPAWLAIDSTTGTITGIPHITNLSDTTVSIEANDNVGGTATQQFSIQIKHVNHPPTIIPSIPLIANEDFLFSYTVNAADKDTLVGDVLHYEALLKPAWMNFDSIRRRFWGIPRGQNVGDSMFTIRVVDHWGGAAVHTYAVTTLHTNHPPQFSTVALTTAVEDSLYRYPSHASDRDGPRFNDQVRYRMDGASWLTVDSVTGRVTGTPRLTNLTDTLVSITAYDNLSAPAIQSFSLSIRHTNHAPAITSVNTMNVTAEDSLFTYRLRAVDRDTVVGDVMRFAFVTRPQWMRIDSVTGVVSGVPGQVHVGDTIAVVKVSDGHGGEAIQQFALRVTHTNHPPVIVTAMLAPAVEDSLYQTAIVATDRDATLFSDKLVYRVSANPWLKIDSLSGILTGIPRGESAQKTNIDVTVTDGRGSMSLYTFSVNVLHVNHAPVFVSSPNLVAYEDSIYVYQPVASDPDTPLYKDIVNYSVLTAPRFLSHDTLTGIIKGVARSEFFIGIREAIRKIGTEAYADTTVVVEARDEKGASTFQQFTVRVIHRNHSPRILSMPDTNAVEDSVYQYKPSAFDGDSQSFGDSLCFSFVSRPQWITYDSVSKSITGVPSGANVRDTMVIFEMADGVGGRARQTFILRVRPINHPPEFISQPVALALEDSTYRYAFVVSDVDKKFKDDSVTVRVASGPSWLSMNASGTAIVGKPLWSNLADTVVSIEARDRYEGVTVQRWNLMVKPIEYSPVTGRLLFPKNSDTIGVHVTAADVQFGWNAALDRNHNDTMRYRIHAWNAKNDTVSPWIVDTTLSMRWAADVSSREFKWTVLVTDGYFTVAIKDTFTVTVRGSVTSVEAWNEVVPSDFIVYQNYPNPFNPTTVIRFGLPVRSRVSLEIYNSIGQKVESVYSGIDLEARYYEIVWNATGRANGVYFAVLRAETNVFPERSFNSIKKLLLIK